LDLDYFGYGSLLNKKGDKRSMWQAFIMWLLKPKWIVGLSDPDLPNDEADLGFRIWGVNFYYYKWPEPMIAKYHWRYMDKREFGDVIYSNIGFYRNKNFPEKEGEKLNE
jgi:hypothetical protein